MTIITARWNVDASSDWSTAADWSTGTVPGSDNYVLIATAGPQTITHDTGDDTVYRLIVGADQFTLAGGSLTSLTGGTFAGTFTQTGGTLDSGTSSFVFNAGAMLTGGAAGPGSILKLIGQSTMANYAIDSAKLWNTGTVVETGPLLLNSVTYNAAGDFSLAQNPNGPWSYLSAGTLLATTFIDDGGAVDDWLNGESFPNEAGIFQNTTGTTVAFDGTSVLPPGYLELSPEDNGDAAVSFTAPASGQYIFTGNFLGADTSETLHTVAIDLNGTAISTGTIQSYGQTIAINLTENLAAGETISFVNQTGPGDNPDDLGTGLALAVTEVAQLVNDTNAVYDLTTDDGIATGAAGASITNQGLFEKTGGSGTSVIAASFFNLGTIAIDFGAIQFDGASNTVGGTVEGTGTLEFSGGSSTLRSGLSLDVPTILVDGGATLALGDNFAYGGTFDVTGGGTLNVGGRTLTVSGTSQFSDAAINRSGTVANTSVTTLANVQFENGARLNNTGTVIETGPVQLGLLPGLAGGIINPFSYPDGSVNDAASQTPDATFLATDLNYNLIPGAGTSDSGDTDVAAFLDYNGQTDGSTVSNPAVADASVANTFFQMDGYIALTGGVTYTFLDSSDDGSILTINGTIVINDDGLHGNGNLSQAFAVAQTGLYAIDVRYFENDSGGASLLVQYSTGGSFADLTSAILYHGSTATETITNAAGAVYDLTTDDGISGTGATAKINNQGLFEKTGGTGTSHIGAAFNNTGSIAVTSGTLELDGAGNTLGGSVSGQVALGGATALENTLTSGAGGSTLTLVNGSTVTVAGNFAFSGDVVAGPADTILLAGHFLTLSGSNTLAGLSGQDVVIDPGTLVNSGTTTLDDVTLGGVTLSNTGTIFQTGSVTLGNASGAGKLVNAAGGIYDIAADTSIAVGGTAVSSVTNQGVLEKTAATGVSAIYANFSNTGTIGLASGTIELDGVSNVLGGSIAGIGTLALGNTIAATLQNGLTAAATTTLLLEGNNTLNLTGNATLGGLLDGSYNGAFNTIVLATHRLTLSGSSVIAGPDFYYDQEIDGPGALTNSGVLTTDAVTLGGLTLTNTGTILDSAGGLVLGDTTAGSASLVSTATGVFDITTDVDIDTAGAGTSTITNQGLFEKTGGDLSHVDTNFTNTGTIAVASGVVELDGGTNTLGGTVSQGTLALGYNVGATLQNGFSVVAGATLQFDGNDALNLTGNATIAGSLIDEQSNTITLGNHTLTLTGTSFIAGYYGQVTVDGPGRLANSGNLTLASAVLGGLTLSNTGIVTENNWITLGDTTGGSSLTNATAGVYDITNDTGIYTGGTAVSTVTNQGLFEKTASTGTSNIYAGFASTGTVDATGGIIEFDGNGSFSGSIAGAGTVGLSNDGTYTIASGTHLTVAELYVTNGSTLSIGSVTGAGYLNSNYATVLLAGNLTVGSYGVYGGYVALNGHNFSISGAASLSQSTIDGPGKLTTAGTTSASSFSLGGGATWVNSGTIEEAGGGISLADSNGAGTLTNNTGAVYDFTDDDDLYNDNASYGSIVNYGIFEKTGGTNTSYIVASFYSTGTVAADSGTMQFYAGGTLGRSIIGAGTVEFSSTNNLGDYTILANTTLGVADLYITNGVSLTFAGAFNYAGYLNDDGGNIALGGNLTVASFIVDSGTVELNGHTFSVASPGLSGATVDGPGIFATAGTTSVTNFYLGGGATWTNSGIIEESGYWVTLADPNGAGNLLNKAGAVYDFTDDYGLGTYNSTYGSVTNQGLLEKTGGTATSYVYASISSTGTVAVAVAGDAIEFDAGGTLGGSITGSGTIGLNSWNALRSYTIAAGAKLSVADVYVVNGTSLTFANTTTYAGSLDVNNGTITLDGNVSIGSFTIDPGTIELNGHSFSVTGASLYSVTIDGAGALVTAGITSTNNVNLGGGATWVNTGTVEQSGGWNYLYDNNGAGTLINKAGASYDIGDDSDIYGLSNSVIMNQGVFAKTGGTNTSAIQASFTNTGTVTITGGVIELDNTGNLLGGRISGTELALAGGSTTTLTAGFHIDATTTLYVENGATLSLGANITFGGIFDDNAQYGSLVDLDGYTLSLTGTSEVGTGSSSDTIDGPGKLANSSNLTLESATFGGGAVLTNTGTITESASGIALGDGTGTGSLVNAAAGVFDIVADVGAYNNTAGSSITNQGLFEKTASTGTSAIAVSFINTGTVDIAGGVIELDGNGNLLGGRISGTELALGGGSTTTLTAGFRIDPTATLYVENGATLSLGTNATIAGVFDDTSYYGSLVELGGDTLTLTGASTVGDDGNFDTIDGSGKLANSGSLTLDGATFGGGVTVSNTGTVTEASDGIALGDGAGSGSLTNAAAGVFDITADIGVSNNAGGSSITNQGLFEKTASTGSSAIAVSFINTGTVAIASGTIELDGIGNLLGGTIAGSGQLVLGGGNSSTLTAGFAINPSATVDFDNGATLTLGANVRFAGTFDDAAYYGSLIETAGYNLTLTGSSTVAGTDGQEAVEGLGTLTNSGSLQLGSAVFGGGATLNNTADITQSGNSPTFGDGNGGATLNNAAGGTYAIADDTGIGTGGSGASTIINYGLFGKSGGTGTSQISPDLISSGTIAAASGLLDFTGGSDVLSGTITGAGQTEFDGFAVITGALTETATTLSFIGGLLDDSLIAANGGSIYIAQTPNGLGAFQVGNGGVLEFAAGAASFDSASFVAGGGTLALDEPGNFQALIKGFGSGDAIDLTNVLSSSITSMKFANGALTVATTNGTDVLHFAGSYSTASFTPEPDGSGNGTNIVFHT